jgi:hypothetical protein
MNAALLSAKITPQRLSRLSLWLCLIVIRFAAQALAPRTARRVLSAYAHAARLLLVAQALKRVALSARNPVRRAPEMRRLTTRRVVGSVLRRAMRRGTPGEQARVICAVLATPARWIAIVVRRLRRRFTKLRRLPNPPRVWPGVLICAPRVAAVCVNSS